MAKDRISKVVLAGQETTSGLNDVNLINIDSSSQYNSLSIKVKNGMVSYKGQLLIKSDATTDDSGTTWGNMKLANGFPPSDGGISTTIYFDTAMTGYKPNFEISSDGFLQAYVRDTPVNGKEISIEGFYMLKS